MFPASFGYVAARSVEEALELMVKHGEDGKLLAGGHSLIPAMKLRLQSPRTLIDLGTVPGLRGVRQDGAELIIGALTVRALRRTSAFPLEPLIVRQALLVNVALAAVAAFARVAGARGGVPPVVTGLAVESVLVAAYLAALWYLDARWMHELRRRVEVGPA